MEKIGRAFVLVLLIALSVFFQSGQCDEPTNLKFTREIQVLAPDGETGNWFGHSVSLDSGVAIVGAPYDDVLGSKSGSAYIFRDNGSGWALEQKLTASDGAMVDQFGYAVAVSGDTVVVGAPYDDDNGPSSGSAYIFRFNGATWMEQAKLTARDGEAYDLFGAAVAIDGNVVAIGSSDDDDNGTKSGSVYVFRLNGTAWPQEQKLLPGDGAQWNAFGHTVAMEGNAIVVGAHGDDDAGPCSGSAYLFRYDGASWIEEHKFVAGDGSTEDHFGHAVALEGNSVVIGAFQDDEVGTNSGSAYLFRLGADGWIEEQKFVTDDSAPYDYFGDAVAIEGERIAIGAYGDDAPSINTGSVYIFRLVEGSWILDQKLLRAHSSQWDEYGSMLDLDNGTLIVGAHSAHGYVTRSGAAYIYTEGVSHTPVADAGVDVTLECTGESGAEVILDGSGSTDADSSEETNDDIVWFRWFEDFNAPGSTLLGDAELLPVILPIGIHDITLEVSDYLRLTDTDDLQVSVVDTVPPAGGITYPEDGAVLHEIVTVTDDFTDVCDTYLPRTYDPASGPICDIPGEHVVRLSVEDDTGNVSSDTVTFTIVNEPPVADAGDDIVAECAGHNGTPVLLDGSGSTDPDSSTGTNDDIVHFDWYEDFGLPTQTRLDDEETCLLYADTGEHTITLQVTDLLHSQDDDEVTIEVTDGMPPYGNISAPPDRSCHGEREAPVFVWSSFEDNCDSRLDISYSPPNGTWKLTASRGDRYDYLGNAVAADGDNIVVGAYGDDDMGWDSGSAYVFTYDGTEWSPSRKLTAADGQSYDYFGYAVAVDGDNIVIGALGDDDMGSYSGSVYVFTHDGTEWIQTQKLTPADGRSWDYFGYAVAVDGDNIVIGAYGDDDMGSYSGSAYVFTSDGTEWIQTQKLTAADGQYSDYFGVSVAVDGNYIVIGAYGDDDRGYSSGSAYVFTHDGTEWIQARKLTAADGGSYDYFGRSVAVDGDNIVIGAYGDDDMGYDAGSAYVFNHDGTNWNEDLKFRPDHGSGDDRFGHAVAVHGDNIVIGAYGDDDLNYDAGSAYIFDLDRLYRQHGDYTVTVSAEDDAGNVGSDTVEFYIDLEPPVVTLTDSLDSIVLPSERPFTDLFTADDDDGAGGDVTRERVFWDYCLVYDGLSYGDRDGLLNDEIMVLDHDTVCSALRQCGLSGLDHPIVRAEGIDCAGNTGMAERVHPIVLTPLDCITESVDK